MNDLFKFISELTNIAKNKTNITNVPTVIWKNPIQQQEDKIEQVYLQFLKSQEWGNILNQVSASSLTSNSERHRIRIKREIQAFTKEKIKILTKNQIQALRADQISWLKKFQIKTLTEQQIPVLTSEQMQSFTSEQIEVFTQRQNQTLINNTISDLDISKINATVLPTLENVSNLTIPTI